MSRPDIFLFNPTCEYAVANGNASWQPNRLLQKMEEDLGTLPLFFARPEDIVLVKRAPSGHYLSALESWGIPLPGFGLLEDAVNGKLSEITPGWLKPWGWSPAAHRILKPLKKACSREFLDSPASQWLPRHRDLYSKKFALEILRDLLPLLPPEKVLTNSLLPRVCTTRNETSDLVEQWDQLMIKAPWSSSGRGLQPITKKPVVPKVWEKVTGIINEQGYAMAEPLLDKVLDIALQFELKKGKVTFLGMSIFLTDKKGQYQGNYLKRWPQDTPEEVRQFAGSLPGLLAGTLAKTIENSPLAEYYEGVFGVDTLLFRDRAGALRVNPCLEINVRQNMGLLSLRLAKLLAPQSRGVFKTFYQPGHTFLSFKKAMEKNYPPRLAGKKMHTGFFALTEATHDTLFGAYLLAKAPSPGK